MGGVAVPVALVTVDGGLPSRKGVVLAEARACRDQQATTCRVARPEPRRLPVATDRLRVPGRPASPVGLPTTPLLQVRPGEVAP